MLWKHSLLLVLLVSILINIKVGPLCYPVVPPLILGLFFNVRDLMERPLLDLFFNLNETYISPHTEAKFSHPYLNLVMNFRVCKTFSFLPLFLNREKRKKEFLWMAHKNTKIFYSTHQKHDLQEIHTYMQIKVIGCNWWGILKQWPRDNSVGFILFKT